MGKASRQPHNGIQYVGLRGVTHDCEQAIVRLVQFGEDIERARILSSLNEHCLLLTIGAGDLIAVKSGFTSGYSDVGDCQRGIIDPSYKFGCHLILLNFDAMKVQ
jgi:hypothetical protein